jgi:glycosyltransferase involved in cell wall biosynthesis
VTDVEVGKEQMPTLPADAEADVSVVVTSYNESDYIQTAIDSLNAQTKPPTEVIFVDANSDDGTVDIIREQMSACSFPTYLLSVCADISIAEMRNTGLRAATTPLITFLDGDDKFRSNKLAAEVAKYLDSPDAAVVYSDYVFTNSDGSTRARWTEDCTPPTGDVLVETLCRQWPREKLYRNPLIDRELLLKLGGFDSTIPVYEDWELRIRLATESRVAFTGDVLTEYRQHAGGISQRIDWKVLNDSVQKIWNKHKSLVSGLPRDSRQKIRCTFQRRIHAPRIVNHVSNQEYVSAGIEYGRLLYYCPQHITDIPSDIRRLLW